MTDTTTDPRPEAVLNPVKLGGLVGAAVTTTTGAVLLVIGGITAENVSAVGIAVGAAVTALAALGVYGASLFAGKAAREQATPLSDPRDAQGRRLVPVDQLAVVDQLLVVDQMLEVDLPGQHAADRPR